MEPEMTHEQEREHVCRLTDQLARHVAMVVFIPPGASSPSRDWNSGTVSFLELPGGKFIVTNHHVWDAYCFERARIPGLKFAVAGEGYCELLDCSDAELVDTHEGLDIAILRWDGVEELEAAGKRFYVPKRWPLDTCSTGDHVLFLGFPGIRKAATPHYLHYEPALVGLRVVGESAFQYRLEFKNPTPILHEFSPDPPDEYAWGGVSGSMLYRLDLTTNQFNATGFINAAVSGLQGGFFHAGRANSIGEDGRIEPGA